MVSTTLPPPINLLRGWPSPSLLPVAAIRAAAQRALADPEIYVPGLLYGPDPGFQPLREEIERWMGRFYGTGMEGKVRGGESGGKLGDRMCVTGGASQNLACALQVFSDPVKTRVWMVAPCYFMACRIFEDAGLVMRGVAESLGKGGEGGGELDLEGLERELRGDGEEGERLPIKTPAPWAKFYSHIIYCVPTFSNPSGLTMSLSTRQSLVRLARKYDALIITDDVYDFLQFPISSSTPSSSPPNHQNLPSTATLTRALLPRLVDIDRTLCPLPDKDSFGNTLSNASFSKIVGPGVRTGWAEATPKFIAGLAQCGSSRSGGAPSQLTATVMYELLQSGDLEAHIEGVLKGGLQRRYMVLREAVERWLVPLGVRVCSVGVGSAGAGEKWDGKGDGKEGDSMKGEETVVFGGYFIWLSLPSSLPPHPPPSPPLTATHLTTRAKHTQNLIIAPGKLFEVSNDPSITFPHAIRLCFAWEPEEALEEGVRRLGVVIGECLMGVPWDSGVGGAGREEGDGGKEVDGEELFGKALDLGMGMGMGGLAGVK